MPQRESAVLPCVVTGAMDTEHASGWINRFARARSLANTHLLNLRNSRGHWEGELSSSALSTATAVCALALVARHGAPGDPEPEAFTQGGLRWLAAHQNQDGGWGDTPISKSNISTTALCWAAFGAVNGGDAQYPETVQHAATWLIRHAGGITPGHLAPAIVQRYGKDRTFSVPILTMCALSGRLGIGKEAWRWVLALPFELAAFPHPFYAALRLPVVSYALPALIAIGQTRHHHLPSGNPIIRAVRTLVAGRTLRVLAQIQPTGGGFLEATPLTSFVVMSLAPMGLTGHPVVREGVAFLRRSVRPDGSWPIDTNLATWTTTLSVNALLENSDETNHPASTGTGGPGLSPEELDVIRTWILEQQYLEEHPYTHAPPGAWAWTDLPGGVPDADDTAGALLALRHLAGSKASNREAALRGVTWLLNIQNRDGGIPTLCRGWGALPFDRSSPDLTAHALRAWMAWRPECPPHLIRRIDRGIRKATAYLCRTQRGDGSWIPLWFGNQHTAEDENPVYGTARVLCALAVFGITDDARGNSNTSRLWVASEESELRKATQRAANWFVASQHTDGSWGGSEPSEASVEETALAVESLAAVLKGIPAGNLSEETRSMETALKRGAEWLMDRVEQGTWEQPSPIGFYFAKLWYFEKLYPVSFTVAALNRVSPVASRIANRSDPAL